MRDLELLAPAGSIESMKAAYAAGADAVYIGGHSFGARAYADNADTDSLLRAIDYAHIHGKRLYLTVNTLLKNEEIYEGLLPYMEPLYRQGLDAAIVQDMGVFTVLRQAFPELKLHASTQMFVCGREHAKFLKDKDVSRVVLPRELSMEEIAHISSIEGLETEVFVHGALCVSYSGQCLMSSMIGGRSGNRGRCAQPCRLSYSTEKQKNPSPLLSPLDLCAVEALPELIEAGAYSLKIEGRMKGPRYSELTARIYRKYIDRYLEDKDHYHIDKKDIQALRDMASRGAFTKGYFFIHNGPEMMSSKSLMLKSQPAVSGEENSAGRELKEKIQAFVNISKEIPVTMSACYGDAYVTVEGDIPQQAKSRPLSREDVEKRLLKTGDTPFEYESLEICMEDDLFLSLGSLNELRRNALEKLQEKLLKSYRREESESSLKIEPVQLIAKKTESKAELSALITSPSQLETLLGYDELTKICLDEVFFEGEELIETARRVKEAGKSICIALPHVLRPSGRSYMLERAKLYREIAPDSFLSRNMEGLLFLKEQGFEAPVTADYGLYCMNDIAAAHYLGLFEGITLSPELNRKELLGMEALIEGELIIYGRQILMLTAQCLVRNERGCLKEGHQIKIRDRYHKDFPVRNICSLCYNIIYNSDLLFLPEAADLSALKGKGPASFRLNFTDENPEEIKRIMDSITGRAQGEYKPASFTRGHFSRGVE